MTLQQKITLLLHEVPEDDDGARALAIKLDLTGPTGQFPLIVADHRPVDKRNASEGAKQWMRARRSEIISELTLAGTIIAAIAAIVAAARCC
jgi:hypothetical protein